MISNFVINHVSSLTPKIDEAVAEKDIDKGQQYADIFVELGISHLQKIIDGCSDTIPSLLLKLLSIPETSKIYKFLILSIEIRR